MICLDSPCVIGTIVLRTASQRFGQGQLVGNIQKQLISARLRTARSMTLDSVQAKGKQKVQLTRLEIEKVVNE